MSPRVAGVTVLLRQGRGVGEDEPVGQAARQRRRASRRADRSGVVLSTLTSRRRSVGADDALGGRGEAGDEPQRDAGHLGLGVAGAPRGWQVTIGASRIVGNFHHERTLPTVDSVTSAVRGGGSRHAGGRRGWA